MEALKLKSLAMQQALLTFQKSFVTIEQSQEKDPDVHKLMRDGMIQRFEYCIDNFWKFLKIYLETVKKISITLPSPREILRLALDSILITDDEHIILIRAISARNLTSHTYNEELAAEIQKNLLSYYITMQAILNRLQ